MAVIDLARVDATNSVVAAPICIVGAGMAGLVLARRLASAGRRVVVIESGGQSFDEATHQLNEIEDVTGRYSRAMTGHYRGLGGSSTRWGGRMIPISAHEAGPRPYLSQQGWPFAIEELDQYDGEIEKLFGIDGTSFDEDALPLIDSSGAFARNDPDLVCRWAKWPNLSKCNLAGLMRDQLHGNPNLEIWLNATVSGFELDSEHGRLDGILARSLDGKTLTVRADEFVIAAGGIETTRLLLWLKAASGDHAFSRTEALGHYFQDHLNARVARISRQDPRWSNEAFAYHYLNATRRSLHLELSPLAQETERVPSAFAYATADWTSSPLGKVRGIARGLQHGEFDVREVLGLSRSMGVLTKAAYWRFVRQQFFVPEEVELHLEICAEQLPDWNNSISLSAQRDATGLPKARIEWQPRAGDEGTFRAMIRRLNAYWHRNGLDDRAPLMWNPEFAEGQASIIASAEDYAHPSGTTRMGLSPSEAVVRPDLRCYEVPNLSIASTLVFPTAGSANPTYTLMRMALRLADTMLSRQETAVRERVAA